jgi:hypothetical protein
MISPRIRRYTLSGVGAVLTALFSIAQAAVVQPQETGPDGHDFSLRGVPIERFNAIVERPLFSRSRKPAAVAKDPTAAQSAAPFQLKGVLQSDGQRIALLRATPTMKSYDAWIGDVVDGWTVGQITDQSVELAKDGVSETVTLERPDSARH